ncbi:MAG TPA: SGNH/GDSL hydrolase family protein [Methylomirabilota bacterium]|nr:SGNH/GDSL hydrolase family protein [Methylomirabilota bacterium]
MPSIDELSDDDRRLLVTAMLDTSPGVFRPVPFDPRVGYTLKPNQQIDDWNDSFVSNDLGYRSAPARKDPGVFRVVFVGDSWTFGLGVSEAEAFPRQVEELARRYSGVSQPIEAWSLALPGYNMLNETAALSAFSDLLEPDAVVFCPTSNDVDSGHGVLSNGSLSRAQMLVDEFGLNVPIAFHSLFLNSHLYLERWREGMEQVGELSRRFRGRGVPFLLFFTGRWVESLAHELVNTAEIDAPYIITPDELSSMSWRNPPPFYHPTPEAHREYAGLIYRGLGPELGWAPLPDGLARAEVPVHRRLLQERDWRGPCLEDLAAHVAESIEETFVPSSDQSLQVCSGIDLRTGMMRRSAMILIRKSDTTRRLLLKFRRAQGVDWIYPVDVSVTIPGPKGPARATWTIPARGPEPLEFTVDLPGGISGGEAVEVILEAGGVAVTSTDLQSATVHLVSVTQG